MFLFHNFLQIVVQGLRINCRYQCLRHFPSPFQITFCLRQLHMRTHPYQVVDYVNICKVANICSSSYRLQKWIRSARQCGSNRHYDVVFNGPAVDFKLVTSFVASFLKTCFVTLLISLSLIAHYLKGFHLFRWFTNRISQFSVRRYLQCYCLALSFTIGYMVISDQFLVCSLKLLFIKRTMTCSLAIRI